MSAISPWPTTRPTRFGPTMIWPVSGIGCVAHQGESTRLGLLQYRVGSRQRRVSFDANTFTAEAARKVAKDYLARVQLGQDPAAERAKAAAAASASTLALGAVVARSPDAKRDVFRRSK